MLDIKDININAGNVIETKNGALYIVLLDIDSPYIRMASLTNGWTVSFDRNDYKVIGDINKIYKDYKLDNVIWEKPDLFIECENIEEYKHMNGLLAFYRTLKGVKNK